MKIDLPLETWTDVFGFLPRSQLVAFSPHIHDRQFASVLQFFLHKCGQITLGKLHITMSPNGNGPIVVVQNKREFPLANGQIPSNIVNFKEIRLSHYDSSVLVFMQELQRNSLLENVNLSFEDCSDDLTAFLVTIRPLIASINSIYDFNCECYKSADSILGKSMLKSATYITTCDCLNNDWYYEWLYSPREDGKPRLLSLYIIDDSRISTLIEQIKKDFLSSKQAISFFIRLYPFAPNFQLELQNGQTDEKLEIKLSIIDHAKELLISRLPIGANEEWIKEMSKKQKKEFRNIIMDS